MKLSDHERERNANFTSKIVNIMSAYVYVYENCTNDELKIPAIPLLYGIRNKKSLMTTLKLKNTKRLHAQHKMVETSWNHKFPFRKSSCFYLIQVCLPASYMILISIPHYSNRILPRKQIDVKSKVISCKLKLLSKCAERYCS